MSIFNLSGAIAAVANVNATVSRFNADTFNDHGEADPRTVALTFTVRCSFQPVTGQELKRAKLAVDASERVSVWSPTALQLRDRISVAGRGLFEIEYVQPWSDTGAYCKAIAKQLAPQEPNP